MPRPLHNTTGRVEASFASKLVASVNPDLPVIDAFVLRNLGLRLPRAGVIDSRLRRMVDLYDQIQRLFAEYLETAVGRRLIVSFEQAYPGRGLTPVKTLDLVLWQAR